MKKTLIALAVLAASGASIAQVTITGNIGPSYYKSPVLTFAPGNVGSFPSPQGLFINDGDVFFTATEALGTGWSVTARGGVTLRGRGGQVATRDTTVALTTPVGRITAGSIRTCGQLNTILSGVVGGVHYTAQESSNLLPLDKCSLIDMANFSAPVGPVLLSLTYVEFLAGANTVTNVGAGDTSGLTATVIGGTYNKGPLSITADYTSYSQRLAGQGAAGNAIGALMVTAGAPSLALAAQGTVDAFDGSDRTRIVGSYDFGMAKVGLGYEMKSGGAADQYAASVAVPMGAVTLGLDYTARDAQGSLKAPSNPTAAAMAKLATRLVTGRQEGDKAWSSVGVGATYNFSKSANLNVSYITYQDVGVNVNPITKVASPALLTDEYRIRLLKTF